MKRKELLYIWLFITAAIAWESPEIALGLILGLLIFETWSFMPLSVQAEVDKLPKNSPLKGYLSKRTNYE